MIRRFLFSLLLVCQLTVAAPPSHKTQNIMFVMTDGLRWQEVFRGADAALINKDDGGVEDAAPVRASYWRESEEDRRLALLPFAWSTIARFGQIYGDPARNASMTVTNGLKFSYPGYSEAVTGFADPRINSNDKVPNPNMTVLEWLNRMPEFNGRVAAFGAWDVFPYIFNTERSHLIANAGWDECTFLTGSSRVAMLNQLKRDGPRFWNDEPFDAIPFYTAMEYLKTKQPRVLFIGLGETDDWAHAKRYDLYLDAAHRVDQYLGMLWESVQSMPQYKDKTTLIVATDHGRGPTKSDWSSHGEKVQGAENVWLLVIGPDTPAAGEMQNVSATQNQIAATIAALLGKDYSAAVPQSGKPLLQVSGH